MQAWLDKVFKNIEIEKEVDGEVALYLKRYFIFRSPHFKVFLHYIPRPDTDRDPHSHPWNFFSLMLKGGYREELFTERGLFKGLVSRVAPAFSFRKARCVHKIKEVDPDTWTLLFCGPVVNEWGFHNQENGWTHWRKYLDIWDDHEID